MAAGDEGLAKFKEDAEADHGKNQEPFWPALENQHGVDAQDGVGKSMANFVVAIELVIHVGWRKQGEDDDANYGHDPGDSKEEFPIH